MSREERPAFYALQPGGWRDYVTLLHPPYTAWHLSYVAIGAATAPIRNSRAGLVKRSVCQSNATVGGSSSNIPPASAFG